MKSLQLDPMTSKSLMTPAEADDVAIGSGDVMETLAFTVGTTLFSRYIFCFWSTYCILLGSEILIIPTSKVEIVVMMVMQTIGIVIFGVIIGLFGSLLLDQSLLESNVEQQLGELREFLEQVSEAVPFCCASAASFV